MDVTATGDARTPTPRTRATTWSSRLRLFWMTRSHPDPAYVLDAHALCLKRPVAHLGEATRGTGSVVLLLDHAHPTAIEALQTVRATHAHRFDAGKVIVAIENLPTGQADALGSYRRAARVPVFAVDLERRGDRMLLEEALVATRVAAALYRKWRAEDRE